MSRSHSQNYFNFELDAGCCCRGLVVGILVVVAVGHGWLYIRWVFILGFLYSGVKDYNILYYLSYFILPLLGEFGFGNMLLAHPFHSFLSPLSCLCQAPRRLIDPRF